MRISDWSSDVCSSDLVSGETLARSTLGDWRPGTPVNFERPLKLGDELGGHVVSGHVDGVALVRSRQTEQGSLRHVVQAPSELAKIIAYKGSVAQDGVSMTDNEVDRKSTRQYYSTPCEPLLTSS